MNFDDTARLFGPSDKLWPELFSAPTKDAKTLCRECRKVIVSGIKRYCGKCGRARKLAANRASYRRRLNSGKTENSPVRPEPLTKRESPNGYHDPQRPIRRSFSSSASVGSGAPELP